MILVRAIVLFAATCMVACSSEVPSSSEVAIANGVVPDSWDWTVNATVALTNTYLYGKGNSYCSGTVIAPNVVLTAGHCIDPDYDIGDHYVVWGRAVTPAEPIRKVVYRIRHSDYLQPSLQAAGPFNDLALFVFEGSIPDHYSPFPMVSPNVIYSTSEPFEVAGFGVTREGQTSSATGKLRRAQLRLGAERPVQKEIFLAGHNGMNTCDGDSGGPAYNLVSYPSGIFRFELAAVTSWGDNCDLGTGFYVDIRKYRSWIDTWLGKIAQRQYY